MASNAELPGNLAEEFAPNVTEFFAQFGMKGVIDFESIEDCTIKKLDAYSLFMKDYIYFMKPQWRALVDPGTLWETLSPSVTNFYFEEINYLQSKYQEGLLKCPYARPFWPKFWNDYVLEIVQQMVKERQKATKAGINKAWDNLQSYMASDICAGLKVSEWHQSLTINNKLKAVQWGKANPNAVYMRRNGEGKVTKSSLKAGDGLKYNRKKRHDIIRKALLTAVENAPATDCEGETALPAQDDSSVVYMTGEFDPPPPEQRPVDPVDLLTEQRRGMREALATALVKDACQQPTLPELGPNGLNVLNELNNDPLTVFLDSQQLPMHSAQNTLIPIATNNEQVIEDSWAWLDQQQGYNNIV
jgi:hypothetical protein